MPMTQHFALAAAAILALSAAPALAQPGRSAADPASPPTTSATPPAGAAPSTGAPAKAPADEPADTTAGASGAASASAAGADVAVRTGMSVKDNTGATIGQISDVKTGADGKTTATIKMGADTFAVDTASLAVSGEAATVNATQADIKKMLKK